MTPKTQLIAHDKEVYDIAFATGKDIFGTVGNDGSLRMFDLRCLSIAILWVVFCLFVAELELVGYSLFACLLVYLFICLFMCLFVCLFVCQLIPVLHLLLCSLQVFGTFDNSVRNWRFVTSVEAGME